MYGKIFKTAFTGSMYGKGPVTFSLWSYAIANADAKGCVELNPAMLAPIFGTDVASVEAAIEYLCAPDPLSRTKDHEGKRLIREGQFQYWMPTYCKYREIRNDDDRREYFRQKKAESRARLAGKADLSKHVKASVKDSHGHSNLSTQVEAEAEAEAEAKIDVGQSVIPAALEIPTSTPARSAVASPTSSDADWLNGLKADPAYKGIEVDREHAKMQRWCAEHRKQPTRRRFVNWLNRCDRPTASVTATKTDPATSPGTLTQAERISAEKEVQRIDDRTQEIIDQSGDFYTPEETAEFKTLKSRKEKLLAALSLRLP